MEVGTVGIVDDDRVDVTNLHRQIIHDTASVGRSKTQSAADRIGALNPGIKVQLHEMRLTEENATDLVAAYDVVIDASDNFPTRLALNDASIATAVPVVHASALRFEGTVAVFDPPRGPCYRCLFPVIAAEAEVDLIVDIATLTGAAKVALGPLIGAVVGNDDDAVASVLAAGRFAGEKWWELPLEKEYRSKLDSSIADVQNIASGWYLQEFPIRKRCS